MDAPSRGKLPLALDLSLHPSPVAFDEFIKVRPRNHFSSGQNFSHKTKTYQLSYRKFDRLLGVPWLGRKSDELFIEICLTQEFLRRCLRSQEIAIPATTPTGTCYLA
jgi:hypothetical protein